VSFLVVAAPGAHAARPPQPPRPAGYDVTPSECLTDPGGGYYDYTVASADIGGPWDAYVYCRYQGRGLFHIAARHPIPSDGSQDDNFVKCVMNIGQYGSAAGADPGHYALRMNRIDGGTATLVYQQDTYEVVSVHTSDAPRGNNWDACANLPETSARTNR